MSNETLTVQQLQREVVKIAEYINQAKQEIAAISLTSEQAGTDKNLATAALELNEVVRHTEEATNAIMDNAELIMQLAAVGFGDRGVKINEHAMHILEACSFQDITGQRIKKVLKTLEQIELRVGNLVKLFGGTLPENFKVGEIETGPRRADEALMSGPQLAAHAPSQEEVDRLFNQS